MRCVLSFILGVAERSKTKKSERISRGFPKKERVVPGLGPGRHNFLRSEETPATW